jgi:hypothetical protein
LFQLIWVTMFSLDGRDSKSCEVLGWSSKESASIRLFSCQFGCI